MRLWLPLLVLWWLPASARAVGQGEATLAGGIGPALAFREQTRAGVEAEARLLRGISDSWAARLGLQTAWYPADGMPPSCHVTAQSLGLTWAADALNLVPFADLGYRSWPTCAVAGRRRVGIWADSLGLAPTTS